MELCLEKMMQVATQINPSHVGEDSKKLNGKWKIGPREDLNFSPPKKLNGK